MSRRFHNRTGTLPRAPVGSPSGPRAEDGLKIKEDELGTDANRARSAGGGAGRAHFARRKASHTAGTLAGGYHHPGKELGLLFSAGDVHFDQRGSLAGVVAHEPALAALTARPSIRQIADPLQARSAPSSSAAQAVRKTSWFG